MISNRTFQQIVKFITVSTLFLISIFSRSFIGIYIFGYRIGEYLVLFAFLVSIILIIKYQYFKTLISSNLYVFHIFLILNFIVSLFFYQANFTDTYIFKSSSYIWAIAFIYIGFMINKYFNIESRYFSSIMILLPIIYILQTGYFFELSVIYPSDVAEGYSKDNLLNFFINYSDKFETYKGTDLLLFFVTLTFILNRSNLYNKSKYTILYFACISALFLPLFLKISRAAAFSALLYVLLEGYSICKANKANLQKLLFVAITSFVILNLSIANLTDKEFTDFDIVSNINDLSQGQEIEQEAFLKIIDGRVYSSDGNFNWRLQIWQDVIDYSIKESTIFFGSGYQEVIPAMQIAGRDGSDGLNENVHNFLVNIYARGGLLQLGIFSYILILIFINFTPSRYAGNFYAAVGSLLFASLFDASMENVHFPMILYLFIGYIIALNRD